MEVQRIVDENPLYSLYSPQRCLYHRLYIPHRIGTCSLSLVSNNAER